MNFELPRTGFEITFYLQILFSSDPFRVNLIILSPGEFYRCEYISQREMEHAAI